MRPIDLAREHGISAQAVRHYEDLGVLPAADRAPSGHRRYADAHASALRAFLGLVRGHGHAVARAIMVAVVEGRVVHALELLDRGHADLLEQRRTLDAVERALGELTGSVRDDRVGGRVAGGASSRRAASPLPVGALAHQLRLRPATLRRWESAGLLRPLRDRSGHRGYTPADVRDAHLIAQLRRSGYPLARIAPLLDDLRTASDPSAATAALADRRRHLHQRARSMLHAAALLHAHLAGGVE